MASTTLRLQRLTTVFDDFRMASTTLSEYGKRVRFQNISALRAISLYKCFSYYFAFCKKPHKTFSRCARPVPFSKAFMIASPFTKAFITTFPFTKGDRRGVGWTSPLGYRTTDNYFLRFQNLIFSTRLPTSEQLVFRLVLCTLVFLLCPPVSPSRFFQCIGSDTLSTLSCLPPRASP